ncbi:hypothetical protein GUJ93_ZPchr0003g17275 [Zizania palustris]|uniref:Uncharacterized protein n=1 Tax=Zizania palustris TaxID=103762 RepID=A0A8J5VDL3_ZIZPA|nr:hypothetical protein GUJ93_ZPchr0003g17275 [Zizania palustris]
MDDSSLFMEWAIDTLQHLHSPTAAGAYADGAADHTFPSLQVLRDSASHNGMAPPEPAVHEGHRATNSWSSGDTDSGVGGGYTSAAAMEQDGWSTSPNSLRCAPPPQAPSGGSFQPMTWNFKSALTQPCNEQCSK